jgi:hypothetical protein
MNRRQIFIALILYTLAWGWMLLLQNPVWDDWILLNQTPAELLSEPDPRMPVYAFFALLPHPVFFYHLASFIALGLTAFLGHRLIAFTSYLKKELHYPWLLLFLLLPFNNARLACINFPYALSLLLFIGGWIGLIQNQSRLGKVFGILAIMGSFMTPSLLVFFYAFWLLYGYISIQPDASKTNTGVREKAKRFILKQGYLLSLPLLAWWLRSQYFQPEGLYQEYYAVNLSGLVQAPGISIIVLVKNAWQWLTELWNTPAGIIGIGITGLVFVLEIKGWISFKDFSFPSIYSPASYKISLIGMGAFLLICAVFPYVTIGKEPGFQDWLSRHQLLMAPGCVLFISGILLFLPSILANLLFRFLLFSSLTLSLYFGIEWKADQAQFSSICKEAQQLNLPDSVGVVIISLPENFQLARNRQLRFYELGGHLHQVRPRPGIVWFTDPPGPIFIPSDLRTSRYFLNDYGTHGLDTARVKNRNFILNEFKP